MKLPKMEDRHNKREYGKRDICAYTLNNPATFNQIMEATGLSESYTRFLIFQLKFDKELKMSNIFDNNLGRNIVTYESITEHYPVKYVRKDRFEVPQPNKKLDDNLISTVLKKLSGDSPKAIAIDLNIKLGQVYWIRNRYGNSVL